MPRFTVAYSAALYVEVIAENEEQAKEVAAPVAELAAASMDTTVQAADWIVINSNDVVSVTWDGEEDDD